MKRTLVVAGLVAALLVPPARAGDKPKADDEVAKAMSKIAALGPGVHAVKKDAKGRIATFVVVGQGRVSTTLGKAKGLEVARDKAKLDASAQLVKWLGEKVEVHQTSDDETILFVEGSGDNDKARRAGVGQGRREDHEEDRVRVPGAGPGAAGAARRGEPRRPDVHRRAGVGGEDRRGDQGGRGGQRAGEEAGRCVSGEAGRREGRREERHLPRRQEVRPLTSRLSQGAVMRGRIAVIAVTAVLLGGPDGRAAEPVVIDLGGVRQAKAAVSRGRRRVGRHGADGPR